MSPSQPPTFGELVRRHREQAGLTQGELAGVIEFDHSFISRIENGRRQPSIPVVNRFAAALDLRWTDRIELAMAAGLDLGVGR